ncbi:MULTISPECIES: hypothetical protein [unclassified Flavobacterium]|uniref:hypothetical protein n=1 Tax=unclassified Flavobacterium TaxID=196869 RepID=UPI0013D3AE55|nr:MULTISPECIES: hypothetical protein [unclassified Flavobacterium]MBA5792428.1 hypothetical protein [Flavobacterium sp. xlx-221]
MKYLPLLLLLILSACQSKEDELALDFVKIDIFSSQLQIPSSITIDLKSRIISFSDLTQMVTIPEDCEFAYDKLKPSIDFEYIQLNDDDFKDIKVLLGKVFISEIKRINTEYINNKNNESYLYDEGSRFRINFAKDSTKFTTEYFIILDGHNELKIYQILKVIKKHTKSTNNKKYIEYFSLQFEELNKSTD